ncbi:hypothetical protein HMPREF1342_01853, partial [Enterococcus faecalis ERV85]
NVYSKKLNWRKGDRVDDQQNKNYPILQNCFSVALFKFTFPKQSQSLCL